MSHRTRSFIIYVAVGLPLAIGVLSLGAVSRSAAMNLNLAMPWSDQCSSPQRPELVFYSRQSDDLLFDAKRQTIDIVCQAGLRAVALHWTLARNTFLKPFRQGAAEPLPANRFVLRTPTEGLHPGFYDIRVKLDTGTGTPLDGVCTFGYRVHEMAIRDTRPADFTAYWHKATARLAAIPLEPTAGPMQTFAGKEIDDYNVKHACLPPDYDPTGHHCSTVESCKVSFAGPDGGRVYGWLAKPVGTGPFPAMLVLPGAGFNARPRPLEHARHDYLALDIQVHGQDVDLPAYPQLPGYYSNVVYEPISSNYSYNLYLRAVQAINYLVSRPDVDPKRIVVVGGSQGGRLSIIVPALDHRVGCAVAAIAHGANEPYQAWADECNAVEATAGKGLSDGMRLSCPPKPAPTHENTCNAYYDPMNFAPDVQCPVLMNAGLIDPISPPSGVFAAYSRLGTQQKSIVALPGLGHDWSAEFDRRAWRWLAQHLPGSKP